MYPKYKLIINTNSYIGNYNRELMAYVFNFCTETSHEWTEALAEMAAAELEIEMPDNETCDLLYHFYDEYGQTVSELSNLGKTLTVYFEKNPSKYFDLIVDRLKRFPEIYEKSHEYATKNVKIVSVNLAEVETVTRELKAIKL